MSEQEDNKGNGHQVAIIVNGQEASVQGKDIGFAEITTIAYPDLVTNPDAMFTVAYRKGGNDHKPAGQLLPGETVKVKKDMVFDVVPTTKS